MEVSEIYTYPIKSLRGVKIDSSVLTKNGLPYDRRFLLCRITEDAPNPANWRLKTMQVAHIPEMGLFNTELIFPDPEDLDTGHIVVTYTKPGGEKTKRLETPLMPSVDGLDTTEINLYGSKTQAYFMPESYRSWFSACFGYPVALVYIGPGKRELMFQNPVKTAQASGWLSSMTDMFSANAKNTDEIHFQDVVPYLFVSQTSCDEVSRRLPDGVEMDISKFRPNIVIKGASEPWEEDFWAESTVGSARIVNAHNCGRCQSINVQYETGKYGQGEAAVLKKLTKDRRVDVGHKYSPIFGRYSFLDPKDDGTVIHVGDVFTVTKRNTAHTSFDWDITQ